MVRSSWSPPAEKLCSAARAGQPLGVAMGRQRCQGHRSRWAKASQSHQHVHARHNQGPPRVFNPGVGGWHGATVGMVLEHRAYCFDPGKANQKPKVLFQAPVSEQSPVLSQLSWTFHLPGLRGLGWWDTEPFSQRGFQLGPRPGLDL